MKKLVAVLSLIFALSISIQAEKIELGTFQIPKDQKERIVLENEIGRAEFLNPELVENLVNCKVVRITYVYSAYAPHGFDQGNLNKNRIANLHKIIEFDQEKIKWNEVAQTDCKTGSCATEMLHGFVIDFVPKSTFHYGRIDKQNFDMNCTRSKNIKGKHGTEIQIPANSFTYADGKVVKGEVQIELREAIDFENIVKGNLLTITDEGELLQTGGMIQIQAYSNGKNLKVKEGKVLNVSIPEKDKREGMQFYSGELEDGKVVWNNPVDLGIQENRDADDKIEEEVALADSISPWIWGFTATWTGSQENKKGNEIAQFQLIRNRTISSIQLSIGKKNYIFRPEKYSAQKGLNAGLDWGQAHAINEFLKREDVIRPSEISEYFNPAQPLNDIGWNWIGTGGRMQDQKGVNFGGIDSDLAYTFSMNNLGWANIDRLAKFPETYRGNLEVDIRDISDTAIVSIALIVPSADVYIPGYKMKAGNYAFTHGDFENNVPLPKNETAYIVATFNEGGKDYFGTKKIRIGLRDQETLSMLQRDKKTALKEIERLF